MAKVEEQWQNYKKSCYGSAPMTNPTQERECRQAFISGMLVAIGLQDQFARMPDQTEAMRLLGDLHADVVAELFVYASEGVKGPVS